MGTENIATDLVYVTGFGPFVGHETLNASWEAVKLLPTKHTVDNRQLSIKLLEIPVVYDEVDRYVDFIWKEKPKLVIHCGVHGHTKNILLEKHAYNKGYCRPDYAGKCLENEKLTLNNYGCKCTVVDTLSTKLNVDKISAELNLKNHDDDIENDMFLCSTEVGNYLCGYTYLKSLDVDIDRTLFIHVPPIDSPFSSKQTSVAILKVLEKCVKQLIDANKM